MAIDSTSNRLAHEAYDVAGNVLTNTPASTQYHYDAAGMLALIEPQFSVSRRMIYTADDERIGTIYDSGSEWTIRDFDKKVLTRFRGSANDWVWLQDYVYANGQLVGGERDLAYGGRRHHHLDHLGSVRMTSSDSRTRYASNDYFPFGIEQTPLTQEDTNFGYGRPETMKFTGHERDFVGGWNDSSSDYLDYMHARYYNPNWGRFLSVDPGKDWDPKQPQSWNMYAYVRNNPVGATDPDGRAIDVVVDVASAAWGIGSMWKKALNGEPVTWRDNVAVTVDIASAFIPGLTGGGTAIRAAAKADDLLDTTRGAKGIVQKSKAANEMAADLQKQLGKNSVPFETATTKGHIDLAGKAHYDKATQQTIPTPHVQTKPKSVSPDGTKTNLGKETTRPATKQDVRTARELEKRRGNLD
jgi:RHS repeat-associated protein